MDERLTGHVEPYRRDGREVRGRWRLVVNLPRVPVLSATGDQERDARGRPRWRYPTLTRTVDAGGVRAAEQSLSDWIGEIEAERSRDPRRLTVSALLDRWLEGIAHEVRPVTLAFYTDNARRHLKPTIGEILAAELRPSDLTRLYAARRAGGLGETSLHHIHTTAHAAYAWAIREELLERNPCERVKRRAVPKQETRDGLETWTQAGILRALALAAPGAGDGRRRGALSVYVPCALAAWSGLRDGEVCGLRWTDIDLESGILTVWRSIESVDSDLHVVDPKSVAGLRVIPIPTQLVELLAEHKRRQDAYKLAHRGRWNHLGYVCPRTDGRVMNPDTLSSAWARFVKRYELPALTFHGLRHSYATDLFESAPNGNAESMLKIVQERLGHASPATTARIYLHVTERSSEAATAAQESRIAEAVAAAKSEGPAVVAIGDRRRK